MTRAAFILLASVAVIHCGGPAASPSPVDPAGASAEPEPRPGAPSTGEEGTAETDLDRADAFGAAAGQDGLLWHVVSTARDEQGATYITGTFTGTLALAEAKLTSRGSDDVFLVKVGARGSILWARAVGSALRERSPRVSLNEGRVNLLGLSPGQMDCGTGPLATPTWSSETFFLCVFGPSGALLAGGMFPTGAPP